MMNIIEYNTFRRAKIGWHHATSLLEHLCIGGHNIPFVYYRETLELLIVDDKLIEFMDYLKIDYELREPPASIKYIKGE